MIVMLFCRADRSTAWVNVAIALTMTFGAATVLARQSPAPVVEGSAQTYSPLSGHRTRASTSSLSLEERLRRVERHLENQTVVELLTRMDNLQQEMQRLVGEIEVLGHQISGIKKRQRDLYLDIDRRVSQVEQSQANLSKQPGTTGGLSPATGGGNAAAGYPGHASMANQSVAAVNNLGAAQRPDNKLSADAYERAFNQLKDGRYDMAIASFKAFIEAYPTVSYADNAQYWLGEANYAQQRYKNALTEFNKVLDNYPKSAKIPDAMLKIGYSYGEIGDKKQAKVVLDNILSLYPDSTAARLAKKRIKTLTRR